ncbi:hypothetical protein F4821DRAFT_261986 [Hypoxylon rubiginosum]|uniref:Uncharacterized protein n=1 Tax=Hypoxylon rubiginosum TaxID=110542 RepID=A0ACC0CVH7_9PEZI|nr:hypothetical protein F4821DRAFT_261986 [Hypoxylon rubiginosum]
MATLPDPGPRQMQRAGGRLTRERASGLKARERWQSFRILDLDTWTPTVDPDRGPQPWTSTIASGGWEDDANKRAGFSNFESGGKMAIRTLDPRRPHPRRSRPRSHPRPSRRPTPPNRFDRPIPPIDPADPPTEPDQTVPQVSFALFIPRRPQSAKSEANTTLTRSRLWTPTPAVSEAPDAAGARERNSSVPLLVPDSRARNAVPCL